MLNIHKIQKSIADSTGKKETKRASISSSRPDQVGTEQMEKKEKMLSAGIYILIIVVTVALMLILFNIFLKG